MTTVTTSRRSATVTLCALICLLLSILSGSLGALYYVPDTYPFLKSIGLNLQHLRPLHTTFAGGWIFLAAIATVYHYLTQDPAYRFSTQDKWRYRSHMILWGLAGLGAIVTLLFGLFSGREYLGFHPGVSVLIFLGWVLFAWNFIKKVSSGFWSQPVYVYMWTAGTLIFIFTFIEGHSWLLPGISLHPIVDLQIQWKSAGLMVGSFNLFVYGTLAYLTEQLSGDKNISHSKWAFSLFWLGLLNSFTNYTHHTYHLPQMELVKWIGFFISMTESLILLKVIVDLISLYRKKRTCRSPNNPTLLFIASAKWWTCFNLALAIAISIPPINTLIHGTHVVFAHAMGSMIGIDSMVLLAGISFLISTSKKNKSKKNPTKWIGPLNVAINVSLALLLVVMVTNGLVNGVSRYLAADPPGWLSYIPYAFAFSGLMLALSLGTLATIWLGALWPMVTTPKKSSPNNPTQNPVTQKPVSQKPVLT